MHGNNSAINVCLLRGRLITRGIYHAIARFSPFIFVDTQQRYIDCSCYLASSGHIGHLTPCIIILLEKLSVA